MNMHEVATWFSCFAVIDFIFAEKLSGLEPSPKIDFNDTAIAFSGKGNKELKWEYWLFRLMNNPTLTKFFSGLAQLSIRLHLPVKWIIRKTVYEQFCGGESLQEIVPVLKKLEEFHIDAIIDYGVEGKETEQDFERTKTELIRILEFTAGKSNIPFISCKVTGLTSFALLEKLSSGAALDATETQDTERLYERMHAIAAAAEAANTGLFIDAEESWIQPAIDAITFTLCRQYNKKEAVVYHTAQLYRHDRLAFCKTCLDDARTHGYITGIKLVRGAYMEKERKRAQEKNYPSPIQPDKETTDRDYNAAIDFCLQHIDNIAICVATHNEASSMHAATEMAKKNIPPGHLHVSFSQLYGMSDQITYNLAKAGYRVSKYLPYGPVKDVIPYLIRRANENTSVSGQMSRELTLLDKEIKRRRI